MSTMSALAGLLGLGQSTEPAGSTLVRNRAGIESDIGAALNESSGVKVASSETYALVKLSHKDILHKLGSALTSHGFELSLLQSPGLLHEKAPPLVQIDTFPQGCPRYGEGTREANLVRTSVEFTQSKMRQLIQKFYDEGYGQLEEGKRLTVEPCKGAETPGAFNLIAKYADPTKLISDPSRYWVSVGDQMAELERFATFLNRIQPFSAGNS